MKQGEEAEAFDPRPSGRWVRLTGRCLEDLRYWIETDRRIALRLVRLIQEILRDPFSGIGKPEPLQHGLRGCWSRRLTGGDRVLYTVSSTAVDILMARYHYEG